MGRFTPDPDATVLAACRVPPFALDTEPTPRGGVIIPTTSSVNASQPEGPRGVEPAVGAHRLSATLVVAHFRPASERQFALHGGSSPDLSPCHHGQ